MVLSFEDTPLFDWLKRNRLFILAFVLAVVAIQGYRNFVPQWRLESQRNSWALYQDIVSQFDPTGDVSDSLARSRQDERIFPWFVYAATQGTIEANNAEALRLLKPELEQLAAREDQQKWTVPTPDGPKAIAAILLDRANRFLQRPDEKVVNPEPTGSRVKITLSTGGESGYSFTVGLYEEQAPATCAAFLAAVEAGRFLNQEVTTLANRQASWHGMAEEGADNLPLERSFGIFHTAGAMGTVIVPGEPGKQNADTIQLLTADNFGTDGTTTVFAQVVDGLEGLQELVNSASPEQKPTIQAIEILS